MLDDPYSSFKRDDMILRDWLALDRTVFANKRTFLAYARTAIALIVLGIALVKFIDHDALEFGGFLLMAFGSVIFIVGLREYWTNQGRFERLLAVEKEMDRQREEERPGSPGGVRSGISSRDA